MIKTGKVVWSNPKSGYMFAIFKEGYGLFGHLKKGKKCRIPKKGEIIKVAFDGDRIPGKSVEFSVQAIKILKKEETK